MSHQLGGRVEAHDSKEFGYAEIRARGHSALLRDIEDRVNAEGHGLLDVWMSHGDRVVDVPPGFKVIASTPDLPIAGIADITAAVNLEKARALAAEIALDNRISAIVDSSTGLVKTAGINDSAITTAKINDGAVTTAKLNDEIGRAHV